MSRRLNLAAEHGYSMMAVMLVMLATTMLAGASFAAVGGDIPFARAAQDRKQAYAAAEAGLEYYLYQLARDNDYWAKCTDVPPIAPGEPAPINQASPASRVWRNIAGQDARFSIELLPAPGKAACDKTKAEETMIDPASGTFRIRSTGESRGIRRAIVATFRRSSFLDFLYFTDYETKDPLTYTDPDDRVDAVSDCVKYRAAREGWCTDITFPNHDAIRGPLHTNDDLLTCGSPDFGRDKKDAIEIVGPAPNGWTSNGGSGCGGSPDFLGTKRHPAPSLAVPTSNAKLKAAAQAGGYVFTGQTTIRLNQPAGSMTVTTYPNPSGSPSTQVMSFPGNGVIYVDENTSGGTCGTIDGPLEQNYSDSKRCAILTVSGTYPKSMTLGSKGDILIDGDLKRSGDVVLGLIAESFVRIKHPTFGCNGATPCAAINDVHVQAAILTLAHSFIVDNYDEGARLGTLKVDGAIAQRFRGPVGTFSSSTGQGVTGYTKDYNYDDRLRYRSPPYFLDPISAAWRIVRANEQVPAPTT
jgi:hypothetical protein